MANIYQALQGGFAAGGDCLLSPDGESLCTYAELERESARSARLLHRLGVAPGDRVMVQVQKSAACLPLYLGALRAGAIYLPLNPAYTDDELRHFIDNAAPRLVVCDPARAAFFARAAAGAPRLTLDGAGQGAFTDALEDEGEGDFPTVERQDGDTAVILYTSGTTGKPKGAMLSHGNLAQNARALHQAWQWRAGDLLLHALPLFHVHGLFVALHPALLNASPIILLPAFSAEAVIQQLPNASVYMGVPTHYTRLLASGGLTRAACKGMRLFACGSAPLLPQTFAAFKRATGHEILERYGMTETGINASNPVEGARKPGTVGLALPGVEVKIVGEDQQPVAQGETGMLLVRGGNVFSGYWRMPELAAEYFTTDGYFATGDLASMDADGYIAIVGRSKDLVISGGMNVYPKEVEAAIDGLPGVAESAVIGLPHADFGEGVCALVVRESEQAAGASQVAGASQAAGTSQAAGAAPLTAESVIAQLRPKLANFKLPKWVFFVESLPRNTLGKVQKNLLRDEYRAQAASGFR